MRSKETWARDGTCQKESPDVPKQIAKHPSFDKVKYLVGYTETTSTLVLSVRSKETWARDGTCRKESPNVPKKIVKCPRFDKVQKIS